MNSKLATRCPNILVRQYFYSLTTLSATACCWLALLMRLEAQTDNFNSGTDAGWSKITSANYSASYSFPPDDFGGHAYRLQGAATPSGQPGRVVAYLTNHIYTDFYLAVDIVAWDSSLTNDQAFGL